MGLALAEWERPLVERAWAAMSHSVSHLERIADGDRLRWAYEACERIIRQHSRTFHWASALLPAPKRQATRALYAFCRVADDIVDAPQGDPSAELARWRRIALEEPPPEDEPIALAWTDVRIRYRIPKRYAEQLLDTLSQDLQRTRYETFEELAGYCYGVASTVGLMSMHIIGFSDPVIVPYAVRLGVALQLTNILRDVGEDWQRGRLYLPLEELQAFGLSEEDIETGRVDERWRNFMAFQIARVHRLYEEALPGVMGLNPDGRLAIAAAAELYRGILEDIERHDFDVFRRRAHLSRVTMLIRLPRIWWRVRTGFYACRAE
ncbi:MAG: squalene/phytoene synthase family protein [Thermoflexus sp.]|nr:squalene/phytoene synthase family protein [Thermoflexus sp.]